MGKYKNIIFLILVIIFTLLYLKNCSKINDLKQQEFKNELNQKALKDSIVYIKNKAGEIQAQKDAFVGTYSEIKNLNSNLYDELKKQKDNVISLTNINAVLNEQVNKLSDSIRNSHILVVYDTITNIYTIYWDFNQKFDEKNYRIIEGHTNFSKDSVKGIVNKGTILDKYQSKFNIVTGFMEEKNQLKIFVKSDYPGLEFNDIQGALIDPNNSDIIKKLMKQKKWHVSVNLGYGLGITSFRPDFYLGAGVSYNIW
jgi:hypothetical protein